MHMVLVGRHSTMGAFITSLACDGSSRVYVGAHSCDLILQAPSTLLFSLFFIETGSLTGLELAK